MTIRRLPAAPLSRHCLKQAKERKCELFGHVKGAGGGPVVEAQTLDQVSTGIIVTDDSDGHVAYHNSCACKLLGISSLVNLRHLGAISIELRDAFLQASTGKGCNVNFTNDLSSRVLGLLKFVESYRNMTHVPAELQEQIFVPLFTTKKEGSCIGLSLSRQIMRLHNGSISLTRSEPTTFTLIFK